MLGHLSRRHGEEATAFSCRENQGAHARMYFEEGWSAHFQRFLSNYSPKDVLGLKMQPISATVGPILRPVRLLGCCVVLMPSCERLENLLPFPGMDHFDYTRDIEIYSPTNSLGWSPI